MMYLEQFYIVFKNFKASGNVISTRFLKGKSNTKVANHHPAHDSLLASFPVVLKL